jgi:hypothetical protein
MNKVTKRSCIFCNKPAGSAEHALPKWLAKTMDREWEEILPASLNEIDGWKTKGKPRSANKLITKKVCHACNNGWMAKLEDQTKSNLQTLVDSSSKNFDRLSLSGRNIDYGTIVRWSIKTALCLNQIMPSLVEKLPPEASDWAISGKFPNSIFVYAGWINNSDFKTKISRGFRMFNGGEFQRNQEHRYSFDFSIQLNFFAIRVANAPDADWGLMSYLNGSNEKCAPVIWDKGMGENQFHLYSPCFYSFEDFTKIMMPFTNTPQLLDSIEVDKATTSLQKLIP